MGSVKHSEDGEVLLPSEGSRLEDAPMKIVSQSHYITCGEGGSVFLEELRKKPAGEMAHVVSLKNCEEEVVHSLKNADLDNFLYETASIGAIPQAVKTTVNYLDPDAVPRPLMVRYLLLHVYEWLEANPRLYERWLKVLGRYVSEELLCKVRQGYAMLVSPKVSAETMCLADGIEEGFKCGIQRGEDQLSKHGMSLNYEEPLPKRPRLAAPPVEIVSQSRDITVVEGKSTLLEVQVETRDQTNISYQWLKDGIPLEEGGEFSGDTRPILYLHATSLTSGAYICAVRFHDGADSVSSEPILVQISLPPLNYTLKKILVDRYCSQPEIPADSWPPQSSNTYMNLALIKQGSINDAGEYARNTIQGNMDDVMAAKESVAYETVFNDFDSGAHLLIEGRPGSGKTTLVHKFSRDWATGGIFLRLGSIKLLFLVHLRAFLNDPDIGLRKVLQCYYTEDSEYVGEIVKFAGDHSGEGLCFILDGLDEYSPKQKENTFIFRLIKKELLPKAVVIVASRPAATAKIRRIATKRVEVLGFMKEQIYQYMGNYKFSTIVTSKRADLRKYLDEHPNVHHMCYLPIHCAMVCFLFDITGSCLPQTETEMYTEFTKHTLLRTLTRSGVDSLNSPENLPSNEKEIFRQICKLGFEKTIASKQVMKKSELEFFMDLTSGNESLGLITVDRMAGKCGYDNLYSFLHLTFQEYLAAYHISKLAEDEQLKLIRKYGNRKCMYVVWKFFCGLVEFQESNVHIFDRILASKSKSLKGDLYSVQCAFESQQAITCDSVVRFGECGTLSFVNVITPSDFSGIVYILTNTTAPINTIVFKRCDISTLEKNSGVGVRALADSLKHCPNLQTLNLRGSSIGDDGARALAGGLKHCPNLQTLNLGGSSIGGDGARALAGGLKHCPNLQTLNLGGNSIGDDGARALADGLKHCPNLQTLDLKFNSIGDDGARALAGGLKHCPNLQTLYLGWNSIGDDGARALADGLKHCPNLQTLNLEENSIGDDGATAIADCLKHCPNLQILSLGHYRIGGDGATAIADGLKHCPNLQILSLGHYRIGRDGARALADGLKHCPNLQILKLLKNSIRDDGARALADGLKHCPNLQTLNLGGNSIGDDGARAITDSLKHCPNMQTLNLRCNTIGDDCAKAIAVGLKHCPNLQTLDLELNIIGDDGARAITDSLKHCPNMQTLNLRWNMIGGDCAMAIAVGLKHCPNLQTLILS